VIVAVVDTGIDITHPDLAANVWHNPEEIPGNGVDDDGNGFVDDVDGWDFTTCKRAYADGQCFEPKAPGPDVTDEAGHGTHIAGTIAAVGDNSIGIIGVAPQAQVMAVKGLNAQGRGTNADLAAALMYAAENGAKVINASWSGPPSDTIRMAIDYATERFDAVVVAAAGNDAAPLERGYYPANLPNAIAVGATMHTDEVASFSNFGGPLDLVAPGGGDPGPELVIEPHRSVLSLWAKDSDLGETCRVQCRCETPECCADPECDGTCENVCSPAAWVVSDQYLRVAGTSQAAPHVSGAAALVRSGHPEFTRAQVRQVLRQSADDLGPTGWDMYFGSGRVNAQRAVTSDTTPVASIGNVENRGKLWAHNFPFTVTGTAMAPSGTVREWRLTVRDDRRTRAREVGRGTTPISAETLGTLNLGKASGLRPGRRYVLRLEVDDTASHTAVDTKTFLISDPQFAVVPIPDPRNQGAGDAALTADGTRIAFSRVSPRGSWTSDLWVYDTRVRELRRVATGELYAGTLSATGNAAIYFGYRRGRSPHFRPCRRGELGALILSRFDLGSLNACLPLSIGSINGLEINGDGNRVAFISDHVFDPSLGDSDGSWELFLYNVVEGTLRQITNGPKSPYTVDTLPEVFDLALSTDGSHLAFTSLYELDPTASANGRRQLFTYDDRVERFWQVTGRPGAPQNGERPSWCADGSKVAFHSDEGLFVADTISGTVEQIADDRGSPSSPFLSADGRMLAFQAALDLDPRVGNEDLNPEAFLMDLVSGAVHQATDSIDNPYGVGLSSIDAAAHVFIANDPGDLSHVSVPFRPGASRLIRRRPSNRAPLLSAPTRVLAQPGATTRVALRANDPDGDPVVFTVRPLWQASSSYHTVLVDHGDGMADLHFMSDQTASGTYPLRVAAFDDAGGAGVRAKMQRPDRGALSQRERGRRPGANAVPPRARRRYAGIRRGRAFPSDAAAPASPTDHSHGRAPRLARDWRTPPSPPPPPGLRRARRRSCRGHSTTCTTLTCRGRRWRPRLHSRTGAASPAPLPWSPGARRGRRTPRRARPIARGRSRQSDRRSGETTARRDRAECRAPPPAARRAAPSAARRHAVAVRLGPRFRSLAFP
jgi:Tol biopolymer transport system component